MTGKPGRKFLKITGVIVLILVLGIGGVSLWLNNKYTKEIRKKLPGIVSQSTNGLYHISFESAGINILTRTITVRGIRVWHDSARMEELNKIAKAPKFYFDIAIPKIQIQDIQIGELIGAKEAGCGELWIIRPKVVVTNRPEMADSLIDSSKKKPQIKKIFANNITIKNPTFIFSVKKEDGELMSYASGGKISFTNWEYNLDSPQNGNRFLFAEKAVISLKNIAHKKKGWLYEVHSKSVYFNSEEDSLMLQGISIKSIVSKDEFYRIKKQQKDMFDVSFPEVYFSKLNWRDLLKKGRLNAQTVTIKDAVVQDYFSRLAPPNTESKMGNFPQQLLLKIDLPITIPETKLVTASGSYTEVNKVTKQAGTLLFTHVNGTITNITNEKESIAKNNHCIVKLHGKFMRQSDISATFNFVLDDASGAFSVSSHLKNVDAAQIDKTAQALALAEIKSVHISRMDVNINGNENRANANFKLLYNDMKVKLQKMNDDSTHLKRRGFLSFLANNVFLYPANPMLGEEVRTAETSIERNKYKSFFNLVWKNIFEGTIKTAARNDDIIELLQSRDNDGQSAKKSDEDDSQGLLETIVNKREKKKNKKKKGNE